MCTQSDTLAMESATRAHGTFLPWEVDAMATPLPGSLLLERDVGALFDEDRDMLTTSVALFYLAFRRTWGKFDMSRCDLHPSCSRFALEAVRHTPLWLAIPLTFARLMSNHNDPNIPRDRAGQKLDPVTHYTFSMPSYHPEHEPVPDPSITWFRHARAIKEECPR